MKILIVDDSKTSRVLLTAFLQSSGHCDILEAQSANEAIDILCGNHLEYDGTDVDIIIMDIVMPEIDGIKATIRIKSMEKFRDIPIIMVTAKDEDGSLEQAFEAGAIDYINKPVNKVELKSRLRSILKLKEEMDRRKLREQELVREVFERKKAQEQMTYLANHDSLTGLPNRFLFNKHFQRAVDRASSHNEILALLIIDLDHFKNVNDTLGHTAGDKLLIDVAKVMLTCFRETDILARIGGDEFYLILEDIKTFELVSEIAGRIIDSVSVPFDIEGNQARIGASIGIAIYPNDDNDPTSLIRKSDIAMYKAKSEGRNNFKFFDSKMDNLISGKVKLINQLHGALERGEFKILYHPKLDIRNHKIVGAEALLRWMNPNKGMIMPEVFIPVLEETGLIIPVGEWVFKEVCCQYKKWIENKIPAVNISINLSPCQIKYKKFIDRIKDIINEIKIDPCFLEIEITELISNLDMRMVKDTLNTLKSIGFQTIIMDNFGTGNASLTYLRNMPINGIKIDRNFIKGIMTDYTNAALVNGIIAIALGLNYKSIVAEGVENESQIDILRQMGCNYYQGFLFCQPLSADEITKKLIYN